MAAAFDPAANPFAYAGEYRDPAWHGTYLRARWYAPGVPTFIGRDPATRQLNHYGYAGGDPLMRVDPSGASFRGFGRDLGGALGRLNAGVGGHFARFFLGSLLGPLQILANPRGFWRSIEHDRAGMDFFFFVGVVAEVTSSAPITDSLYLRRLPFLARIGGEAVLGTAQSATASVHDHWRHFDARTFGQGLEYTFGLEFTYRVAAGVGYQPFDLSGVTAAHAFASRFGELRDGEVAVFRVREPPLSRYGGKGWTTPWLEGMQMGFYHERLIGFTRNAFLSSEHTPWGLIADMQTADEWFRESQATLRSPSGGPAVRYQFVGVLQNFQMRRFLANPTGSTIDELVAEQGQQTNYHWRTNNSHHHATALLQSLGLR